MNNTKPTEDKHLSSTPPKQAVYLVFIGSAPRVIPYYKVLAGVFSTKAAADEAKDTLKLDPDEYFYSNAWRWVEVWNMDILPRRYR